MSGSSRRGAGSKGNRGESNSNVLTISELAAYLRVSRVRIYQLVKHRADDEFPVFRMGRSWCINLYDFQDWMCRRLESEKALKGDRARQ